jgi:large subunit ribosomal protein LP0
MAEEYDPLNPPKSKRAIRKESLMAKLNRYLQEYKNVLICTVDNVGSHQMQKVRMSLRGRAVLLMGKNTICRKAIREHQESNPSLEALVPFVKGNIGFVFTNGDLNAVRKTILENKVPASAKQGSIAPIDVYVPPGPTGLDPGQTAFFQALNISTKIARGSIEIISTVHLIKAGEKVSSSHVALLAKLNIAPFHYSINVSHVYEGGSVYEASVLDLTKEDLYAKFFAGVRKVAALSLAIGYPTTASLPHIVGGAFRKLLYISSSAGYDFKEAKLFLAAAAAGPSTGGDSAPAEKAEKGAEKKEGGGAAAKKGGGKKEAAKPKEPEPEPEADPDEDVGGGMAGMFGDD